MNILYKISVAIILAVLIWITSGFAQISVRKDNSVVLAAKGNCKKITEFFLDAFILANNPGGLIAIQNSCPENVVFPDYKPEELSFRKRLELITQMNPNYKLEDEQGVTNLVPTKSIPELLNVKIHNLKIAFDTNLDPALNEILRLPEVVEKLQELHLRRGMQFGGLQSPPSKRPPIQMEFKDKTLRQILNEIVRKRGRGVWVYNESNYNGENNFSLEFLVQ